MLKLNLESLKTTEALIINKIDLQNAKIKLTISRKAEQNQSKDAYLGICVADMYLESEENIPPADRSFCVRLRMEGCFAPIQNTEPLSTEDLHDAISLELFPHIRATFASLMSSAGMTPYLIPNSIVAQLS